MRRARSLSICIALPFFLSAVSAAAATPGDIAGSPYKEAIQALSDRGVVHGYADGRFKPGSPVNRAESLEILLHARYPDLPAPDDLRCFTDLEVRQPQWYASAVCAGRALGIVSGYPDGTFQPSKHVNLAEALKMSALTFGLQTGAPDTKQAWHAPYIALAKRLGILSSLLGTPSHTLTRGEMAEIAYRFSAASEAGMRTTPAICGDATVQSGEQCDDGNLENGDGCSKICVLVPEPIRHAALLIEQETTGTVPAAAKGKPDVDLLKFSAIAGRQDAILTGLTFAPSAGSLFSAQHYALAADMNGDGAYETILQREGKVRSDRLVFDTPQGPGTRLKIGSRIRFVVRADLTPVFGTTSFGLRFAASETDYVEAIGAADGSPLTGIETDNVCGDPSICWIRVHTVSSADIEVSDQGNLFVTADVLPARSRSVIAGSTTETLLRLRLRSENEDVDVTKLQFSGGVPETDSLLLYRLRPGQTLDQNTAIPFAQASNGQCGGASASMLCVSLPSNALVISPNDETIIAVAAKLKNDQAGAVSGRSFALTLSAATDAGHAVEAGGKFSSHTLRQNDGDDAKEGEIFIGTQSAADNAAITGPTHDIGLAGIRSIANGNLLSSATGIPPGTAFAAFRISAHTHGNSSGGSNDLVIKTMIIRVNAQNVSIDPLSFRLSTTDDPTLTSTCAAGASTGGFDVTCINIDAGQIRSHIESGQDATYALSATITDQQISQGSSLLSAELASLGQRGGVSSITWSDEITTFTWADVPESSVSSTVYRQE